MRLLMAEVKHVDSLKTPETLNRVLATQPSSHHSMRAAKLLKAMPPGIRLQKSVRQATQSKEFKLDDALRECMRGRSRNVHAPERSWAQLTCISSCICQVHASYRVLYAANGCSHGLPLRAGTT